MAELVAPERVAVDHEPPTSYVPVRRLVDDPARRSSVGGRHAPPRHILPAEHIALEVQVGPPLELLALDELLLALVLVLVLVLALALALALVLVLALVLALAAPPAPPIPPVPAAAPPLPPMPPVPLVLEVLDTAPLPPVPVLLELLRPIQPELDELDVAALLVGPVVAAAAQPPV